MQLGPITDERYLLEQARRHGPVFKIARFGRPIACVVGIADKRLTEVPGAAVEFKGDVESSAIDELEMHVREHLLATHIPVHWRFVESLPKTPSFKIDRPAVKRLFEQAG